VTHLAGHGVRATLPRGWEARIYRRAEPARATTHAVLHAATFPLPNERGDFGAGAVELMGPDDVFVTLIEFHPDAAGSSLFRADAPPRSLAPRLFSAQALQRALPGQGGAQVFFRHHGRAWCLYVVLGSHRNRFRLVPRVNELLAAIDLDGGAA
jgi:hypothetical protein